MIRNSLIIIKKLLNTLSLFEYLRDNFRVIHIIGNIEIISQETFRNLQKKKKKEKEQYVTLFAKINKSVFRDVQCDSLERVYWTLRSFPCGLSCTLNL